MYMCLLVFFFIASEPLGLTVERLGNKIFFHDDYDITILRSAINNITRRVRYKII